MKRFTKTLIAALPLLALAAVGRGASAAVPAGGTPDARTPTSTAQVISLAGLGRGHAPRMAYTFAPHVAFLEGDWRLVRTDGTTLRLPDLTWSVFATLGRGAVGMAGTEAGPLRQVVSGTGTVREHHEHHFGLAISPDRSIVGWLGNDHAPYVLEGGGSRHFGLPQVPGSRRIGAIAGRRTCQEAYPEGGGCTIFVDTPRGVSISTSHGIVDSFPELITVSDLNPLGHPLAQVSRASGGRGSCWAAYNLHDEEKWRTCDYRLDSYSPDGSRILAERTQVKWGSVRTFAVLGRDGTVQRSFTFAPSRNRVLRDLRWEDSRHLLGTAYGPRGWSIVRIGVDGHVEHAVRPVPGDSDLDPFGLPLR